ncbi:hypothetical protein EB18_01738 [Enterococcus cecorum]|uniref:Holin-like toxin n=1 Tax=Enterococcus cecorum TaxID=44008 RepID=A0A366SER6_9ENTE|nr:hypothetical protein EB18_01738 [Enterococcus cecorum]
MQNLSERRFAFMSASDIIAIISIVVAVIFGTLSLVIQIIGLILGNNGKKK